MVSIILSVAFTTLILSVGIFIWSKTAEYFY